MKSWRLPGVTAFVSIAVVSCGRAGTGSVAPTLPATPLVRHVEAIDPRGDARVDARIPVSPDFVRAAVDVAGGTATITVELAPGTLDRETTIVQAYLDTDLNPATGTTEREGFGADYGLTMQASRTAAPLTKADPTCATPSCFSTQAVFVPLSVIADTIQASVDLVHLGGGDGRMCVFFFSSALVAPSIGTPILDLIPDSGLPPACLR